MLHRTSKVAFGGMWVFPGGRVDPEDRRPDDPDEEAAARRAAVREAMEECDLPVAAEDVVAFSHWTPPAVTIRRYPPWFFVPRPVPRDVPVAGGQVPAPTSPPPPP